MNLFWTGTYMGKVTEHENLGDYISKVVVEWMLHLKGLKLDQDVESTTCLYGIGSIWGFGFQDATIWGSGLLREENAYRLVRQKLDIRCVRGPVTRNILIDLGIDCPECFGDPAVLMPLIYKPPLVNKKYKYSIILHHTSTLRESVEEIKEQGIHYIEIQTTDYRRFIDEILSSEVIISSALHGIILGEAHGIPTVYLKESVLGQDLKFEDWYASTGRSKYFEADSLENAIKDLPVNKLPNLDALQADVQKAFPYDLWMVS